MNHHLLRLASRLTTMPMVADIAYGPVGQFVEGTLRRLRFAWAERFPVSLQRFSRSYFNASRGLALWITNVCNARCTFCAYPQIAADNERVTGSMSMEVFQKTLDEYAAAGGRHVDMTPTVGDPLLDPTLIEKIKRCRQKPGIQGVSLTTNAIVLHRKELFKQLIDAGTTMVCISLPDLNAEIYRNVYGVDRCAEVIKGITALLRYNREQGEPTRIILRFRNNRKPSTIIRSPEFQEHIRPYLSSMVTCNFTITFDNWGGSITPDMLDGIMRMRPIPKQYRVPCIGLTTFVVQHDGAVRLCGCRLKGTEHDELVVGNIKNNTMEEVGRSEVVHKIFEGFYQGKRPEVCKQCSFYTAMTPKFADQLLSPALTTEHLPAPGSPPTSKEPELVV